VCALPRKNIRLAEKYFKFGWDLASRKEIRRRRGACRLTKFGASALGGGAGVYNA